MCIICSKPKGIAFPKEETIERCFNKNSQGAGFMYAKDGKVHIKKGFMEYKDFIDALKNEREKVGDDLAWVLHFRISTQAGVCKECCHPYPLTKDIEEMKKLDTVCDIGIAHNGIISLTSDNAKGYNDTMLFISKYISKIIKTELALEDSDSMELIEDLSSPSRLVFLKGNGDLFYTGKWYEENGVFYSNDGYKQTYYQSRFPVSTPKSNYDAYYYSYFDDENYYCNDYNYNNYKPLKYDKDGFLLNNWETCTLFNQNNCDYPDDLCTNCMSAFDCWGIEPVPNKRKKIENNKTIKKLKDKDLTYLGVTSINKNNYEKNFICYNYKGNLVDTFKIKSKLYNEFSNFDYVMLNGFAYYTFHYKEDYSLSLSSVVSESYATLLFETSVDNGVTTYSYSDLCGDLCADCVVPVGSTYLKKGIEFNFAMNKHTYNLIVDSDGTLKNNKGGN